MDTENHISKPSKLCLQQDQFLLFQTGGLIFSNGFSLLPVDKYTPVVTKELPLERGAEYKFDATGTVRIPYKNGYARVRLTVSCKAEIIKNSYITITYMDGHTGLNEWELADGLFLDGEVVLLLRDNLPQVRLKGVICYTFSENTIIRGTVDSTVIFDPSDQNRIFFKTQLEKTSLTFQNNMQLLNGSVHLAYDTYSSSGNNYLKKFHKDGELKRFICTDNIDLKPMYIEGIEDEPVTIEVLITVIPRGVNAWFSVFGARLRSAILGDGTTLFLHHKSYDEPFNLSLNGKWTAYVSSNVFLHLFSKNDTEGASLVTGTAFLTGKLHAYGFTSHKLNLSAGLCDGEAFGESRWPQELPDQDISFTLTPKGTDLNIKFNPVCIGNFSIRDLLDSKKTIQTSLCSDGLSFPDGLYLDFDNMINRPLQLKSFIIDGNCCFNADSYDHTIEIMDWFRLDAAILQIRCERDYIFIECSRGTITISDFTVTMDRKAVLFFNPVSNDYSQNYLRCKCGSISLPESWGNLPSIPFYDLNTSLTDFQIIATCPLPDNGFCSHPDAYWIEFRFIKPGIEIIVKKSEILAVLNAEEIVFRSKQMETPQPLLFEMEDGTIKLPINKNGMFTITLPDALFEKTLEKKIQIRLGDLYD